MSKTFGIICDWGKGYRSLSKQKSLLKTWGLNETQIIDIDDWDPTNYLQTKIPGNSTIVICFMDVLAESHEYVQQIEKIKRAKKIKIINLEIDKTSQK